MDAVKIIGAPVSPYVRKILAILRLKDVPFEIDPIVPFFGDDDFSVLSPLRRIPLLIDGDVVIADSSVIAQYLEETRPEPSILPANPADRAQARWLEEYADTRMGDVFIWRCFNAVVVNPSVWGGERDLNAFQEALAGPVAEIMDYLESVAPKDGYLFSTIGLADISIAVMFRNMRYCRWTPDASRWPKTARWLATVEENSALSAANEWADTLVKTPVADHRVRARQLGVPISERTMFDLVPRRGPMTPAS
jgi:glutathione S-transferase